ncbi:monocarboxylate transporter 14-like [Antedon mediterranea]|uniref:monocarboxylate transporter 14-like n=1 Tax=Antedon mediterranea TaxID=105859 RepID=UPI003AF9BCEC
MNMICRKKAMLDRGWWSWVVLCSSFVAMALSYGVILSLTVYLEDLKEEFDVGSREAGMITGVSLLFATFISPVASYVCNRFGFRATITSSGLIITVSMILSSFTTTYTQIFCSSALTGFGVSFAYTTCSVIMGFYFRRYYVLANGIVFAGVSTGMCALPILFEYLNSQYTWRQCYRIIAAMCLNISVAGALIAPHPSIDTDQNNPKKGEITQGPDGDNHTINSIEYTAANTNEDKETISLEEQNNELPEVDIHHQKIHEESTDPDVEVQTPENTKTNYIRRLLSYAAHFLNAFCRVFELRLFLKLDFIILFTTMYVLSVGYMGTIIHFVARFEWVGFTPAKSSFLLSLMGIGGIVSRLTHGFLVDRHYITAINLYFLNLILAAAFVFSLTFVSSYLWSQILSFFIGMWMGLFPPLAPVIIKDLVGIKRFNSAFGLTIVSYGLADFTGGFFVGWIYDLTEDYNKSFYLTSACLLCGGLLMLVLIIMNKKKVNRSLKLVNGVSIPLKNEDSE